MFAKNKHIQSVLVHVLAFDLQRKLFKGNRSYLDRVAEDARRFEQRLEEARSPLPQQKQSQQDLNTSDAPLIQRHNGTMPRSDTIDSIELQSLDGNTLTQGLLSPVVSFDSPQLTTSPLLGHAGVLPSLQLSSGGATPRDPLITESLNTSSSIGSILISINPYRHLALYTPQVLAEYINRGNRKLDPHVYTIADDAYRQLRESGVGQSIVISEFDWLVERINQSIGQEGGRGKLRSIGILDIFGFEIFARNSFEQLCINFTNEKLQQFFNAHIFTLEEQMYRSEGIRFESVPYIDNTPILTLIEQRPIGVIPLLDEELWMPKGSNKVWCDKLIQTQTQNPNLTPDRQSAEAFVIKHYAGDAAVSRAERSKAD